MVGAEIHKTDDRIHLDQAEYWLVYVHKKQEGAVKQYYILPEFDYNTYRSDFITSSELAKMNEFFSDSRKLYSEHNVGTIERKVIEDQSITQQYQRCLGSYYSVMVPGASDNILIDKSIGPYLHETVSQKGECYILSGICGSIDEAEGTKHFVMDCGLTDKPAIVIVTPNGVEIIEE
jgi:hypothetical protein